MVIYSYNRIVTGILTIILASLFIGCTQENNIPTLDITVEDSTPLPGSTQTLSAVVTDLDTADIVSVIWDISEGDPPAHIGLTIEYTAPQFETVDTIRVEANDQNDGIVTETIILYVTNGSPYIESYTVSQSAVLLGNDVTLSVTASDPESLPLTYHFSSSGYVGEFLDYEPEDSIAIWEAPFNPDFAGEYDLYVTVSDSLGKSTSDTLSVNVYSEHGTMWVVDSGLRSVRKYDEDGNYILSAEETFDYPIAIANNHPDWFGCWVSDIGLKKIIEIDEDGSTIQTYDNLPNISDIGYHENTGTICALSRANKTLTLIIGGTEVKTIYGFSSPNSIAVNQRSDEVLVSDYGHQQIIVIDLLPDDEVYPDSVSSEHYLDQLNGYLNGPTVISITNYSEANGMMIVVVDETNNRIERVPYMFGYTDRLPPISDITQPIALTTTLNYTWIIENEGTVRYFDTFDGSSSIIVNPGLLTTEMPRVITGDYLKDAVWIGDNTTNKIVRAKYNNGVIVNDASITVITFVEDIVVNR